MGDPGVFVHADPHEKRRDDRSDDAYGGDDQRQDTYARALAPRETAMLAPMAMAAMMEPT